MAVGISPASCRRYLVFFLTRQKWWSAGRQQIWYLTLKYLEHIDVLHVCTDVTPVRIWYLHPGPRSWHTRGESCIRDCEDYRPRVSRLSRPWSSCGKVERANAWYCIRVVASIDSIRPFLQHKECILRPFGGALALPGLRCDARDYT